MSALLKKKSMAVMTAMALGLAALSGCSTAESTPEGEDEPEVSETEGEGESEETTEPGPEPEPEEIPETPHEETVEAAYERERVELTPGQRLEEAHQGLIDTCNWLGERGAARDGLTALADWHAELFRCERELNPGDEWENQVQADVVTLLDYIANGDRVQLCCQRLDTAFNLLAEEAGENREALEGVAETWGWMGRSGLSDRGFEALGQWWEEYELETEPPPPLPDPARLDRPDRSEPETEEGPPLPGDDLGSPEPDPEPEPHVEEPEPAPEDDPLPRPVRRRE